MLVTKCDFCKKNIKDNKPVRAGFSYLFNVELCNKCGKPIIEFLKKNKVINPEEIKKYFNK